MPPNDNSDPNATPANPDPNASADPKPQGGAADGNTPGDPAKPIEPAAPAADAPPAVAEPPKPGDLPAEIKYDLKLPDGLPMVAEKAQAFLDKIAADAKARGLSQEQATALLGERAQQVQEHRNIVRQWNDEVAADLEFGGEKLKETVGLAWDACKHFFPEVTPQMLEDSGIGSHPAFVKGLARLGKVMKSDKFVASGEPGKEKPKTAAEIMYPNMAKKS